MAALKAGNSHGQIGQRPFEMGHRAPDILDPADQGRDGRGSALHRPRPMRPGECRHAALAIDMTEYGRPAQDRPPHRLIRWMRTRRNGNLEALRRLPFFVPNGKQRSRPRHPADYHAASVESGRQRSASRNAMARKIVRWVAIGLAIVVVLAVAGAFLMPRLPGRDRDPSISRRRRRRCSRWSATSVSSTTGRPGSSAIRRRPIPSPDRPTGSARRSTGKARMPEVGTGSMTIAFDRARPACRDRARLRRSGRRRKPGSPSNRRGQAAPRPGAFPPTSASTRSTAISAR